MYKKAEVLLLDEATSALDNETERAVNEMLLSLMKECKGADYSYDSPSGKLIGILSSCNQIKWKRQWIKFIK